MAEEKPKNRIQAPNQFHGPNAVPHGAPNLEAPQLDDMGVDTVGNVTEVLSESKEVKGDSSSQKGDQTTVKKDSSKKAAVSIAQIKADLLKNVPGEYRMRKQIEREIHKEIKYLHKKAMRMARSPGSISFFEMNNILMKVRELKDIMSKIVKYPVEALKNLWLRFVHGIM